MSELKIMRQLGDTSPHEGKSLIAGSAKARVVLLSYEYRVREALGKNYANIEILVQSTANIVRRK